MPAVSFFADAQDAQVLVDRLNADPEVAFIVADGSTIPTQLHDHCVSAPTADWTPSSPARAGATLHALTDAGYRQKWKAVRTVAALEDGNHSLWHVPTGPLPLLTAAGLEEPILEPWTGWTEEHPGADPTVPYFGPRCQAHIRLSLWTQHRHYSEAEKAAVSVLISHWDSQRDTLVVSDFQWIGKHYGDNPLAQTRRWWNRLRAWLDRTARRITSGSEVFWAFPSALEKLQGGMAYYARGWSLNEAL